MKSAVDPNTVYSREEAARVLGCSLTTLKQLIRTGHLTVSRPEGIRRVFIKGASILEMLERTAVAPAISVLPITTSFSTDFLSKPQVKTLTEFGTQYAKGMSNELALRDQSETRAGTPVLRKRGVTR